MREGTASEVFSLVGIADTGLGLLGEGSHLLAPQPPPPRPEKPTVTVDIEIGGSSAANEGEFGELLGSGFRLGRVLVVSDRLKKTILFYSPGHAEAAVELTHRIPGDQAVLGTRSLAPGADIKVRLGLDFERQSGGGPYAKMSVACMKREVAVNAQ